MSQQGPGGFGGPPPGGYGGPPPGGGGYGGPPPGGHGGPPGGYGGPPGGGGGQGGWGPPGPGGHGGPPGGQPPPAWGHPAHGYPQQPPPGPAPKKKKSNTPLLLGIGCGVLLLGGAAAATAAYYFVYLPAQEVKEAVTAAAELGSATVSVNDAGSIVVQTPNGVSASVTDAGIVVKTPSGAQIPLNALAVSPGGPVCDQAEACCKNIAAKTGGDPSALAACKSFRSLPSLGCEKALAGYKSAAAAVGAACP